MDTIKTKLFDLISLVDRAGLPLIDVQDDIKRNFKDSEARARIYKKFGSHPASSSRDSPRRMSNLHERDGQRKERGSERI